jgi:prolyl 4-hydroxylase
VVAQREIPSLVKKMCNLLNCDASQLERCSLIRYRRGEYYKPHCDEDEGPDSMNGFSDSHRLVTLQVFLNDVRRGGETNFTAPGVELSVRPQKGMAVLHFPGSTDFKADPRTLHEGATVISTKWILVTWLWLHRRAQEGPHAEESMPTLDDTVI